MTLLIEQLRKQNTALKTALEIARDALVNVPEVGKVYDQQHSDTHMAAQLEIEVALRKANEEKL